MVTEDDVVTTYLLTDSLIKTAEKTGINPQSVRRILISGGCYSSKRSEQIAELAREGLTVDKIAERLKIKPGSVLGHLPYTRGAYSVGEKSNTALRIAACRRRKKSLSDGGEE